MTGWIVKFFEKKFFFLLNAFSAPEDKKIKNLCYLNAFFFLIPHACHVFSLFFDFFCCVIKYKII